MLNENVEAGICKVSIGDCHLNKLLNFFFYLHTQASRFKLTYDPSF